MEPGFDPNVVAEDMRYLQRTLAEVLDDVPTNAWDIRSGTREKDWTLKQVVAHLASIASLMNRGIVAALSGDDLQTEDFSQRSDLAEWNRKQIASSDELAPDVILRHLLDELDQVVEKMQSCMGDELSCSVDLVLYNRAGSVLDLGVMQLSHLGVVHAAQVMRPLAQPPLWERYDDGLLHRQIERFLHHISFVYWPDYGPDEDFALNFDVAGRKLHLRTNRIGCEMGRGHAPINSATMQYDSESTFLNLFTAGLRIDEAMASGKLVVTGDVGTAIQVLGLISPNPPRLPKS